MTMATNNPAWEEFLALCEEHGGPAFTKAIAQHVGLEAIATLRYQARRGNTTAAKYLADRWLGEPILPFHERVETMNAEEVREALIARYMAYWGWTREYAEEMHWKADAAMTRRTSGADQRDGEHTDGSDRRAGSIRAVSSRGD
jgi:hypothetical protein